MGVNGLAETQSSRRVQNKGENESNRATRSDRSVEQSSPEALSDVQLLQGEFLESPFGQSAFERHADVLGDSRLSQPANVPMRNQIVRQIQREYGNRYVHRLFDHIQRNQSEPVQTKLASDPASDRYEQEANTVAQTVVNSPHTFTGDVSAQRQKEETIGDTVADSSQNTVNVLQNTHDGHTVHRHAAYEHYLLGQVAPGKLANIPLVRQIPELESKKKKLEKKKKLADPSEAETLINQLEEAKAQKDEVQHTLEQEMDRLEKWMNNPEAISVGAVTPGEVEKGEDGEWQVPYVVIPIKDDQIVATYSEINTLPDLFGNPEAIANTPKDKVLSLIQGVRQQSYIEMDNLYKEIFGEHRSKLRRTVFGIDTGTERDFEGAQGPRAQAVVGKAYEIRTESQVQSATLREGSESEAYFAALERNACHFAPESWAQWERYHTEARKLALESWDSKEMANDIRDLGGDEGVAAGYDEEAADKANKALLQNGFGEHYLQDSFAGGHLVDKTKIMQWFVQWLNSEGNGLGSFKNAEQEWAMITSVANQDLQSNPQALDDMMRRDEIDSLGDATSEVGIETKPETVFMMWWRNAVTVDKKLKHITPEIAAKNCPLPDVKNNEDKARELMESLVAQNFAKAKKDGIIKRNPVYSLNEAMVNSLKTDESGPYDAKLAQQQAISGEQDFAQQAEEFNLASYNSFLSNAYVQAATKYFHDKYCKEGVVVYSKSGDFINRIYGDNNMLKASAQQGVEYSATTSKMSREAIFNTISGSLDQVPEIGEISSRFPGYANDEGITLPLDKWNESLKAAGDNGLFKKAMDSGAKAVYKIKDGISGGNAIDMDLMREQIKTEIPVEEHDGGDF